MTNFIEGWEDDGSAGKGRWKRLISDGKVTACITCPKCGNFGSLAEHAIAADGTVTPSLVCPWVAETKCDFHDMGTLVGWRG